VSRQGSVPHAIIALLDSSDYENAIRMAITIGGNSDTIAFITGGTASTYYKNIPLEIVNFAFDKLTKEFVRLLYELEECLLK
jgi:ADP-ribosyl-[dinitrogen reductase] hydrolase